MTTQPALFDTPTPTPESLPRHPRPAIPDWLADHIATTTGTDPRATHRRAATLRPCPHCHTWTIQGLDADICALPATATAQPLTQQGAAIAILAGYQVWALHRFHGRLELDPARCYHDRRHQLDLVAEHACHLDLSAYAAPSRIPTVRTQQLPSGAPPPF